jgi:hypothetical protein
MYELPFDSKPAAYWASKRTTDEKPRQKSITHVMATIFEKLAVIFNVSSSKSWRVEGVQFF